MNFRDVLHGVAVADAIGNPLEFYPKISHDMFVASKDHPELRISDDTQMTLFLAEGLFRQDSFKDIYSHWHRTQLYKNPRKKDVGLLSFQSLYAVEAPGRTCMSACASIANGVAVHNNSKGNGTVMRVSAIPFYALRSGQGWNWAMRIAEQDAMTTHKHIVAAQCSMFLVGLYLELPGSDSFEQAVKSTIKSMGSDMSKDVILMIKDCLTSTGYAIHKHSLGGWTADEALALAIGAVQHSLSYNAVVENAVRFSGDSDTVASIAGGLAAAIGMKPVPSLIAKLNAWDAINYVIERYE